MIVEGLRREVVLFKKLRKRGEGYVKHSFWGMGMVGEMELSTKRAWWAKMSVSHNKEDTAVRELLAMLYLGGMPRTTT